MRQSTQRYNRLGVARRHLARGVKVPRARYLAMIIALVAGLSVWSAASSSAGVGFGALPNFPTPVTVAQAGVPASLTITNNSDSVEATGNVGISEIRLVPACANLLPDCAGGVDPGVLALSPTAVGAAGTGCAGTGFTVPEISPGTFSFVPAPPVVLGPPSLANDLDTCQILFTFSVLKPPTTDTQPGTPGLQTNQVMFVSGTSQVNGAVGVGSGSDVTTVLLATPTITTQTTPAGPVFIGANVSDTATVTGVPGGPPLSGTVTFTRFSDPPAAAPCSGTSTVVVTPLTPGAPASPPTATASSPATPATTAGTIRYVAAYSGDANYLAVTAPCGAPNENVVVNQFVGTLTTQASTNSTSVAPGTAVTDTATLTPPPGGPVPTGTVTYTLVGPNPDANCTAPVVGAPSTVNIGQPSAAYTVTTPGTYNFVATYSGDPNYAPITAAVGCGVTAEMFAVAPLPTVEIQVSANPESLPEPGGDFTYSVVVTNTGTQAVTVTSLNDSVYGNLDGRGTCTLGATVAANGGTYTCQFTGAFNGAPGASQTNVTTVVVTAGTLTATDDDDAVVTITNLLPVITVDKTATPGNLPEPGGDFTFEITVSNTGPVAVTITTLTDDVYGNIATQGTCTTAIGTVLALEGSYSCEFVGAFTGLPGASQEDEVTATATDSGGDIATASDTATVSITSRITVTKTPAPTSRPEPGGSFAYTVTVTNLGPDALSITDLSDSVYGDLNTRAGSSCVGAVATSIAANGGTYTCQFSADFMGEPGDSLIDTVTVKASNGVLPPFMATGSATVSITDSPSSINVSKTALPPSRGAPGGSFLFGVTVSNTSAVDTVTIKTITDDIYGNVVGLISTDPCGALVNLELEPGESVNCDFIGDFTGAAGASQTDTVTVTALDDDGLTVTGFDTATVTITAAVTPTTPTTPTTSPTATTTPTSTTRPGATTTTPVTSPDVFLTPTIAEPGQAVIVNGSGWNPNESLTVTFNSHPVQIAALNAGPTGSFSVIGNVPLDATVGNHTIVVAGSSGRSVSRPFTVVATGSTAGSGGTGGTGTGTTDTTLRTGTLVRTGSSALDQVILGGAMLLLGSVAVLAARRRGWALFKRR